MYDDEFKKKIVSEYEAGARQEHLRRKYKIGGASTIRKWIDRYGKDAKPVIEPLPSRQEQDALSQQLRDAQLRIAYLETVISLAQDTYGIDLKKKFAGKP